MRSKRAKSVAISNESEVDLTPMLDVVFILLIFFIITASFVKETVLNVNMSEPDRNSVNTEGLVPTIVRISENNTILIGDRAVSKESVRSVFASKHTETAGNVAFMILAHENSNTDTYISVLDAAEKTRITNLIMEPYKGS